MNIPPKPPLHRVAFLSALLSAIVLNGCQTGPRQIDEQHPTVSYAYAPGDADAAKRKAASYCNETFGRIAHIIADRPSGTGRVMTFECVPYKR